MCDVGDMSRDQVQVTCEVFGEVCDEVIMSLISALNNVCAGYPHAVSNGGNVR